MISKAKYLCILCGLVFCRERRGATLLIVLILLLLFALIGSMFMILSINDDRMINVRMSNISALAAAEAGIAEALRRISLSSEDSLGLGDPNFPPNPDWQVYVLFDTDPPDHQPPHYYEQSVQMQLPESLRIGYSTAVVVPGRTLRISHKVDTEESGRIVYYNWNEDVEEVHEVDSYQGKYFPVEIIEATGISGAVSRTLQVEVAKHAFMPSIAAALSCNTSIEISGKMMCCGHNHLFHTTWGTNAGTNRFECFDGPETDDPVWHQTRLDGKMHAHGETYEKIEVDEQCSATACIAGISAPGQEIQVATRCVIRGNPDFTSDTTVDFHYLYQMLNATSWAELEERFPWQPIAPGSLEGGNFIGFYKCDGDLELEGIVNFTGVLWVTGSMRQRGHLTAKGIVYVGNSLGCNGDVWMLGAVAIEGKGQRVVRPFNGSGVLLYSQDAIERAIAAADGYRIVARREK